MRAVTIIKRTVTKLIWTAEAVASLALMERFARKAMIANQTIVKITCAKALVVKMG
jgi:hypothetical protein